MTMTEYIAKEQARDALLYLDDDLAFVPEDRIEEISNAWNDEICRLPAADVAPVAHGKWEDLLYTDEQGNHYYWCTNCHTVLRTLNCNRIQWFSFCPNCGAKMKIPDNIDPAKAFPERVIDDFEKWNKHIPQEVLDEIRKVGKSNG